MPGVKRSELLCIEIEEAQALLGSPLCFLGFEATCGGVEAEKLLSAQFCTLLPALCSGFATVGKLTSAGKGGGGG